MSAPTPGPWMVAAGPSSVVGWPVVTSQGRLICNLGWRAKLPDDSQADFEAFEQEVRANGQLIAAALEMRDALRLIQNGLRRGYLKDQTVLMPAAPDASERPMMALSAIIRAALAKAGDHS